MEKRSSREGDRTQRFKSPWGRIWKGKEENEQGSLTLCSPGPGRALENNSQGFINKTEFFSPYLAHICGSKSDLKVQINFSSLCPTTILKYWNILLFFSSPRNSMFLFGWNKWNHLLLPALQFKPFMIPFPGLFPETWHESETVVKWEIHPPGSVTIYWNSTCKGNKIRVWFAPNAEVKGMEQRISDFLSDLPNWTGKPLSIIKLWCLVYLLCPRFGN